MFHQGRFNSQKINVTTYVRFLILDKIKADKITYLDCDILVLTNLAPLFSINIENYYMVGVTD